MTDHLVSLSKLVTEVCVCRQNSLLISVKKLQTEASKSQNLEFEAIRLPIFLPFCEIHIYLYVCVYV